MRGDSGWGCLFFMSWIEDWFLKSNERERMLERVWEGGMRCDLNSSCAEMRGLCSCTENHVLFLILVDSEKKILQLL